MDNKDFEKIKEICNREGFELINEYPDDNCKFYVIKKKKVKVRFDQIYYSDSNDLQVNFSFQIDGEQRNINGSGRYLEKQLEKFLNGENEADE